MITPPLVGVACGLAAYLAMPRRHRLPGRTGASPRGSPDEAWLSRLRLPLAGLVVCGGVALAGWWVGLIAGIAGAIWTVRVLGRAERPSARLRRERLRTDLPMGIDLLAAALASGSALETALGVVADAVGGPVGEEFRSIRQRLELGLGLSAVWSAPVTDPELGSLGRAVRRSQESGASVADAVRRHAEELRQRARTEVQVKAKGIEVRAAAPLGVCFLPAFVLIGIVPMVVGLFTSLQLFG